MKALEKDRNRRYETANSLAADIERYLNDEPVQACPPSATYRFRKFARRNKAAVVMATVVGSALLLTVAGLAVSTLLITREQRATEERAASRDPGQGATLAARLVLPPHRPGPPRAVAWTTWHGALKLLDECPEDLREWEWHYLMRLCRVEPLVLRDKTEVQRRGVQPGRRTTRLRGRGRDRQDLEQQDGRGGPDLPRAHRFGRQRRVPPRRQAPGLRRRGPEGEGLGLDGDRPGSVHRTVRRRSQVWDGIYRGVQSRRPTTRGGKRRGGEGLGLEEPSTPAQLARTQLPFDPRGVQRRRAPGDRQLRGKA